MRHCDKRTVTVNTTSRCNLRCIYCMSSSADEQSRPIVIDQEFAKVGISDAIKGEPTGIKVNSLRFFAPGEPTQHMEILRLCVAFARSLNPVIGTELQTNGVFESNEDRDWIADNFDMVWFSLDGPPEINDRYRPDLNNFGRTQEAEKNLLAVATKTKVGVRATIVEETLDHQSGLVKYYHKLGIRYLTLNPVIAPIKRGDKGSRFINQASQMRFAREFVRAFPIAESFGIEFLNSMTFNFDEPTTTSCRSCVPVPQLNPDGSVSSCDMAMFRDTKEELKPFLYGSWNKDKKCIEYDQEKIRVLQNHRLEMLPKCRECTIGEFCAGGCIGRRVFQTGNMTEVIPEICAATLYMAKHLPLNRVRITQSHP